MIIIIIILPFPFVGNKILTKLQSTSLKLEVRGKLVLINLEVIFPYHELLL